MKLTADKKTFDAVIFDVDGVIWDSTDIAAIAYNKAFEEDDVDLGVTGDDLKKLFGLTMDRIFEMLLPEYPLEERRVLQEKSISYEQETLGNIEPHFFPGMPDVIKKLAEKYPVYIVSNSHKGYIEEVIRYGKLEKYIKGHLCFGDTGVSKGKTLKILIDREGLKAPVYVGDIQGDADACREAGLDIICAAYGFGEIREPYAQVDSPAELLELL